MQPSGMTAAEINGDLRLGLRDRLRYIWRNALRGWRVRGGPPARPFRPPAVAAADVRQRSPSRILTDLFVTTELPGLIPPRPVEVLDVGCGPGQAQQSLTAAGYSGRYTGVDIQDRFRPDPGSTFEAAFVMTDAHRYEPPRPVDLIFSVSVLEHIDGDAALVARLAGHVAPGGAQVHVVPATASLAVYLWHGYRQYSRSDLARRFGEPVELVGIGGVGSLAVHFIAITVPELLLRIPMRRMLPRAYAHLLRTGLAVDRALPYWPTALVVIKRS
jgi:SAM-dependent methyltransferase